MNRSEFEKVYAFVDVDERNAYITECYRKGLRYTYHDANSEGIYIVEVEETNS